jgi:hypothetical protein
MSPTRKTKIQFPLGPIVVTANAMRTLNPSRIRNGLRRHASGDWGDLTPDDFDENDNAIAAGGRLFSAYGAGEERFWIITEGDRSVTTILLPEDY